MSGEHICPWWIGYILAHPLRKLVQNPQKMMQPYISKGMKILDVGCAMGFFSVEMAHMVGSEGKVVCLDVQNYMLQKLKKKAEKAKVLDIIEPILCVGDDMCIDHYKGSIDFACAFYVAHEMPDMKKCFSDIHNSLVDGGKFYVCEPSGHVDENAFAETIRIAEDAGFSCIEKPKVFRSHTAVFSKQ